MTAPLEYLLITVNIVALEKVCFSDKKTLRLFVNTLCADDKHYLLNRENFTQRIQMQLSQTQKTFPVFFFFAFLKYRLNFKDLPKKGDPHRRCVSGNTGCVKYG